MGPAADFFAAAFFGAWGFGGAPVFSAWAMTLEDTVSSTAMDAANQVDARWNRIMGHLAGLDPRGASCTT